MPKKLTIEYVKNYIEKENYVLLNEVYIRSNIKLSLLCPKKHSWNVSFNEFQSGNRCPRCTGCVLTIIEVREFFEKENYILISNIYEGAHKKLETLCPKGHVYLVPYGSFYSGNRCKKCDILSKTLNIVDVRNVFEKENYKLLSETYIRNSYKLDVQCPVGHDWKVTYNDFKQGGDRCPKCSLCGTSKYEIEFMNTLKTYVPNLIKKFYKVNVKDKPYIYRFGIDILDLESKRGIEFDGTTTHNFKGLKWGRPLWSDEDINNYHTIKDQALLNCHGIILLHIKQEDWLEDKQACVDKCLEFLKTGKT